MALQMAEARPAMETGNKPAVLRAVECDDCPGARRLAFTAVCLPWLGGLSLPHCWQGKWCLFSNADCWTSQSETKKARTVVASRRPRSCFSTARDHVPSTGPETFLRIRGTPTGTCDFGQPGYDGFCRRIQEKNCREPKYSRGASKGSLWTLNGQTDLESATARAFVDQ